jgi:hypothetical protein
MKAEGRWKALFSVLPILEHLLRSRSCISSMPGIGRYLKNVDYVMCR